MYIYRTSVSEGRMSVMSWTVGAAAAAVSEGLNTKGLWLERIIPLQAVLRTYV